MRLNLTIRKKNIFEEIVISLIITILVMLPLLKSGIYRGEDLQFHLSRFDGIIQSIKDGQLPLAIYPYKNYGYGYASPLFYCDLFLIIPSLIRYLFNINAITMYKAVIVICVYITCYTTLHYSKKNSNNLMSSILGTCIFVFSNYYLTDMYVRMALGEIMALSFIPALIYNMYEFIYKDKNNWINLGLLFDCVLFCHNISFVLVVILFGILLIINIKNIFKLYKIVDIIKATSLALGIAAFFIFPMLEQIYLQDLAMNHSIYNTMQDDALSLKTLLTDICFQFNFNYNDSSGLIRMDQKAIGILTIILPLFGFYNFKEKDKFSKHILILGYVLILCTTKVILLYKIPYISFIQYPSRLCLIAIPLLSYSVSISYKEIKNIKIVLSLVSILLVFNLSFLYNVLLNSNDIVIIDENTTIEELFIDRKYAKEQNIGAPTNREELMNGEYLPYQSHIFDYQNSIKNIVCGGKEILNYTRDGTKFTFTINSDKDIKVYIPLTWYPGYYACELSNEKCIEDIELTSDYSTNKIVLVSKAGNRSYYLYYRGTNIQQYSLYISLGTIIILISYLFIKNIQCKKLR